MTTPSGFKGLCSYEISRVCFGHACIVRFDPIPPNSAPPSQTARLAFRGGWYMHWGDANNGCIDLKIDVHIDAMQEVPGSNQHEKATIWSAVLRPSEPLVDDCAQINKFLESQWSQFYEQHYAKLHSPTTATPAVREGMKNYVRDYLMGDALRYEFLEGTQVKWEGVEIK